MNRSLRLILLIGSVLMVAACVCSTSALPTPTEQPTEPPSDATTEPQLPDDRSTDEPTEQPDATDEVPFEIPEATATLEIADRIAAFGAPTDEDIAIYEELRNSDRPDMDRLELAIQLRGLDPSTIPAPPTEATPREVGEQESVTIHLSDNNRYITVNMELVYKSATAYFWAPVDGTTLDAQGNPADQADWAAAGASFDRSVETVRRVFGPEPSPGIDGDEMLYVIVAHDLGGPGGYYSPSDRLPLEVNEHSNMHEMFFVLSNTGVNSEYFNATLAHEFQHMVHDTADSGEEGWFDEGMAEIAQSIAGAPDYTWPPYFTGNPDQPLWYWPSTEGDYGHSLLVMDYLYERFGEQFISDVVANPADGLRAMDVTLGEYEEGLTFDQVYADFATALLVLNPNIEGGIYGFTQLPADKIKVDRLVRAGTEADAEVSQYGLDVLSVDPEGTATFTFTGAQTAQYIPADPHSGTHMMWSTRTDSMYSTMTRAVDLSGVTSATLNFWTWFNTEEDWDYAYVQVSTDGGTTWIPLQTGSSTDSDPNNANYGHGITGRSGGGLFDSVWIPESADLTPYVGQEVLIRFAMFNDEALHEDNFAVDDVSIPEIGWSDDFESGTGDWELAGFLATTNRAPQTWIVRVVLIGNSGVTVQDLEVVNGTATTTLDFAGVNEAYIIISGTTRYSNAIAPYHISIE